MSFSVEETSLKAVTVNSWHFIKHETEKALGNS